MPCNDPAPATIRDRAAEPPSGSLGGRHRHRTPLPSRVTGVVLALLAGVLATLLAPPAMACGCGGVVAPVGTETSVSREVALVTGDGTTETVHMQLSIDANADDLGLLVPTPSPATVSLGEAQVFTDLTFAVRARPVKKFHLFGPPVLFSSGRDASSGTRAGATSGVQALSTVDLGPLEATTLRADDPAALQTWLDEHDYHIGDGLAAATQPYIDEGWTFVAVRLTQQGRDLQGELPPLVMRFASTDLVYPMRMSSAAKDTQSVRTYVLGQHRVNRTDTTATAGNRASVTFAGIVPISEVESVELRAALAAAPYLTTFDQLFTDPGAQIVSDFSFADAADDEGYQQTYTVETYGIPIDIAILLLVVLIAVVALLWWRRARRLRRRQPA